MASSNTARLTESFTTADRAAAVQRAEKLAFWMDSRFRIPGTNRRIGLDGILGLVPGVGDLVSAGVSAYMVGEAMRYKLPKRVLLRMSWNWAVDTVVGTIPLVGDLFDFAWKANHKNAQLLVQHLNKNR